MDLIQNQLADLRSQVRLLELKLDAIVARLDWNDLPDDEPEDLLEDEPEDPVGSL